MPNVTTMIALSTMGFEFNKHVPSKLMIEKLFLYFTALTEKVGHFC